MSLHDNLSHLRRLDEICSEFEENWRAEQELDLGSCLARVSADEMPVLLRQLLAVDVELRKKTGKKITPDFYQSAHPDAPAIVKGLLSEYSSTEQTRAFVDEETDKLEIGTIGPYQLRKKIGEGGMGSVWLAEQQQPIRRLVALKVIKAGGRSKEIIARFEAERQALALMNHPNIARILDAGTTPDRSPFFAMELVQGQPLTRYCDDHQLGIDQRLKLFVEACWGVQHAHQKGIIHRDLKPSNILVSEIDGKPVPKVIDFGLAKALENAQRLTEQTQSTGIGQILGTLKYMSPEQASLDAIDVDTRTDIYSMGVILYQLLTGSTPLDDASVDGKSVLSVLQLIRDDDPVRPSSRLSTMGDQLSVVTRHRNTDSLHLKRVLAGDLDWIVMKALEKDRNRRYDSASSLAEDIQHYLHSEPVTARPPTARYRIGKFARKHRVGVTVATMLGFALILGIAGTTWGLFRALAAEETARARETSERIAKLDALDQKRKAVEARTQAETLAKRTQDVLKIVTDSFKSVNPDSGGEAEMAAKQVLFNAQDSMDASSLDDQGKADLLASLTRAFLGLGEYEAAIETAREQVSLRNSLSGSADDSTITAMSELAGALAHRGQLKKALQLYEFIHETELANFGEEAQVTLESASNLGEMYRKLGRLDESIEMQESTLEVLQRKSAESGRHSENEVMILNNLATAYKNKGRIDEALLMYEQARLAMESFFGEDHPQTLNTIQNLATAYQEAGRIDEALELFEEVRDRMEVKLGPNHPLTLAATTSLSSAYIAKGRFEDAVPLLEQTVEQMKRSVGEDNEPTIIASMNLAYANRMAGHLQEAIDSLQRLSDIATDKFGADHPNTLLLTLHLADACLEANDVEQARDLFESGSETANRKLGARHPVSRALAEGLAKSLQESKQPADAIKLLQQHVEIAKSMEGAAHPRTLFLMRRLAEAYREQGEYDALIPLLEALVENNRKAHGEDHPNTSTYMHNLGVSLLELKRFEQAAEIFQELYDLEVRKSGEGDPSTILPQAGLGACYVRLGRVDEGLAKLNEAWAASDEGREKDWIHDQLVSAYKSLEETALNDGDDDAAGKWRSEMKKIDENTPAQASPLADDSGGR